MKRPKHYIVIILLSSPFVFFSGCLEFESVKQPSSILSGETFTVEIKATVEFDEGRPAPYFGICLPNGWTIPGDAILCTGVYREAIVYDSNLVLEQEGLSPAPEGYYWWVGDGNEVWSPVHGIAHSEIQIQTDEHTGLFPIDYMLSSDFEGLSQQRRSDNHLIEVVDKYTPRELRIAIEEDTVSLSWIAPSASEGLLGYNVYRDGHLLNTNPIVDTAFIDENLEAGVIYYSVSSLYKDGREHLTPYEIKALIFSGGTGEPNKPYQIATAKQLVSIGDFPNLLDKYFVLANDINLDPNLFGGRAFDQAVIPTFSGTFDGNDHTLSHLTIKGKGPLGRFGLFGELESGAEVKNLGIVDVNITGSGNYIGGLVGYNYGGLTSCYITGTVRGDDNVGGLVGSNNGNITTSYSTGEVTGSGSVGGLVGYNESEGSITTCYNTSAVNISVSGNWKVGGLVGHNMGSISTSYSTGAVTVFGSGSGYSGGLVGYHGGSIAMSFWDMETSQWSISAGGMGLTTADMQNINTYLNAGWDFVDEILNGTCDYWKISPGDYPRLHYHIGKSPMMPEGLGMAEQPYLVRDARDLGTVWFEPSAHYRLEASVDLSEITWSMAVIPWFKGTFDGNGYVISNLHIQGSGYLGLFGQLGSGSEISNLGLEAVDANGIGHYVGGLVGYNYGDLTSCYSTGTVSGTGYYVGGLVGVNHGSITVSHSTGMVSGEGNIGGLVGSNGDWNRDGGALTSCYSTGTVSGTGNIGGLVGSNTEGSITMSYSTGKVSGIRDVGGLVSQNNGSISTSYSTGEVTGSGRVGGFIGYNNYGSITASSSSSAVSGGWEVGGLVGRNDDGSITNCYSMGTVSGDCVGGLVGYNYEGTITTSYSTGTVSGNDDAGGLVGYNYGSIATGFWDIETSGLLGSDGGVGLTTAEMMDPEIIGLNGLANDPNWVLDPGNDYPRLAWEGTTGQPIPQPVIDWMDGEGTLQMPYQISSIDQLILLSKASALFDKHFILVNDLDLEGIPRSQAVLPYFSGSFDGNGFSIRNLYIRGGNSLGLIGIMREGSVMNLSLENISIEGTGGYIGGLVGENEEGSIVDCHSNGEVRGGSCVGGLVGINGGGIIASSSSGTVRSISGSIGGLVGCNSRRILAGNKGGSIVASNSTCAVSGKSYVGGLVGSNRGNIVACHSTGAIDGDSTVGGFAGSNGWVGGSITSSYSTGIVTGNETIGGFVGDNEGSIISSFWNVETSGQSASAAGTGLHTAEMYDINTYLNAGWDFVDEIHRGTCDYWQMSPDDYPRLHHPVMPEGLGTIEQPYMIRDEYDLGSIWLDPTANYRLEASVDLSGITWSMALIPWCAGNFDGNDHIISNLLVKGGGHLGLFGQLGPRAEIFNLGLEAVDVNGVNRYIGGLVGDNNGNIATSYSTGKVSGYEDVGGLVGRNLSSITMSHSSSTVTGDSDVGGLVGENRGSITTSYSIGTFSGDFSIGGIVGHNIGNITASYSTGTVSGEWEVGGLVGTNGFQFCNENGCSGGIEGAISSCYSVGSVTGGGLVGSNDSGRIACSFWDVETSGQIRSNSGVGKTTAEMQTAATFLEVGWDFVDESVNGTDETWWIHEGQDYPRLWWELNSEN